MNAASLKTRIQDRLWRVVEAEENILSATLAGSFLDEPTLEGISDIDLIVVVDHLDAVSFERMLTAFDEALRDELAAHGYRLHINPTLGPLKFNEPDLAVLHLMLYSRAAHVEHAIASPFTCFDWQRSLEYRKRSLAEVFPVFNLQPHHFMGSRRSVRDYLRDFHAGVVSYRELECTAEAYRETPRSKPMNARDRHEFAYHILRFLMQNLVKLVRRANLKLRGDALLADYFLIFPEREAETRRFFAQLQSRKRAGDFSPPLVDLEPRLHGFVDTFEAQFRRMFFDKATRHVAFRHGPTALNHGVGSQRVFLGRSDPPLLPVEPETLQGLADAFGDLEPASCFSSPLSRCRQSLAALAGLTRLPAESCDDRLREIDYGALEGLTVGASRSRHADLFEAWQRGEDPKFPGGESTQEVARRALDFARQHWRDAACDTVTCTHNVVLRCLIGHMLGLPPHAWHRLEVPHLSPITFISTRSHGVFVDIPTETARTLFHDFALVAQVD